MVDPPACLVLEGGKKRVVHSISNFYNGTSNIFPKAFLVANLFAESNATYKNDLLAQDGNLKYFTWNRSVSLSTMSSLGNFTDRTSPKVFAAMSTYCWGLCQRCSPAVVYPVVVGLELSLPLS